MKSTIGLMFILFLNQGALAATDTPACAAIDLRNASVGQSCLTQEGFEFKLVVRENGLETWRDVTTQTLWSDRSEEFMTHAEALDWCSSPASLAHRGGLADREWRIPSREEFQLAESHGFRQVLPNMRLRMVWTSTVYSKDPRFAYVFSGSLGTTTSVDMRDPKDAEGYWHGHHAFVMSRCMATGSTR